MIILEPFSDATIPIHIKLGKGWEPVGQWVGVTEIVKHIWALML